MIVADTDVLIDFLRGQGAAADQVAREIERGLATTVVTAFELWAGSLGAPRREQAVETLLGALTILPLEAEDARSAAAVRRGLEGSGRAIGMADSLIAGICIRRRVALLTRNRAHFERVSGLTFGPAAE
ncbi:MAG: type II toxin-antitoxin system VapC family toxin [Myxococcota bacterium]|nr:type II toxin-antitoxin system VapC family toxin [Myxococcota bacterium]